MVGYVREMDFGRHILFHRATATHPSGTTIGHAPDAPPRYKPAERVCANFENSAGCFSRATLPLPTRYEANTERSDEFHFLLAGHGSRLTSGPPTPGAIMAAPGRLHARSPGACT